MAQKKSARDGTERRARPRREGTRAVHGMVEDSVGCKWSLTVLDLVRQGVQRPGAMERSVPGLSTKVLNERLRKLQRYGLLEKRSYPELPPRVEYALTAFGHRFAVILEHIDDVQRWLETQRPAGPGS